MTMRLHDTNTSTCRGVIVMPGNGEPLRVLGPFDSEEQLDAHMASSEDFWWPVNIEDPRVNGVAEIYVVGATVKENPPER